MPSRMTIFLIDFFQTRTMERERFGTILHHQGWFTHDAKFVVYGRMAHLMKFLLLFFVHFSCFQQSSGVVHLFYWFWDTEVDLTAMFLPVIGLMKFVQIHFWSYELSVYFDTVLVLIRRHYLLCGNRWALKSQYSC